MTFGPPSYFSVELAYNLPFVHKFVFVILGLNQILEASDNNSKESEQPRAKVVLLIAVTIAFISPIVV